MRIKGREMSTVRGLGNDLTRIRCRGKNIWTSIAPDIEVFSAEVTNIQQYYEYANGYKEVSRVIDENYFSSVTAPLTLSKVGTDSGKTQTVTTKAYTPTEKALKKYKYAIVTAMCAVGSSYGSASLSFGGKTLYNRNSHSQSNYTEDTFKIELNDTTNIVQYINNMSSGASYITYSNIAIKKIILTNSEE